MAGPWDMLSPVHRRALEAEEARVGEEIRRDKIEREMAARDRAEEAAADRERFVLQHGYPPEDLVTARDAERPVRDLGAAPGSEANPGVMGLPAGPREPAGVRRSVAPSGTVLGREFMAREVADYERRQEARRAIQRQGEIDRLERVISR